MIVESKKMDKKSVYLKCSMPNIARMIEKAGRMKRGVPSEQNPSLGLGRLVNFTEIDLPDNFMEAEYVMK